MSFRVDIQSAPERQGTVGEPSAWSSSGPVATTSGTYDAAISKTFTFTVTTAGVIETTAKIDLDWDDAEGGTGRLNLGTDHGYEAGDPAYVADGFSVSFAAGTFAAAATCTVVCTASNQVPGSPIVIAGDADPTDIQIREYARADMDITHRSFDGRESRVQRATTGVARIYTDYLDDTNRDKLLYLHSSRTPVCIGENYDENTIFLFHGGGVFPMIGDASTYSRASTATYPNPRTGLLQSAATDSARVVSGNAGRAMLLEAESTNLADYSAHTTPSARWTTSGPGLTLSFDTTVKGPYDLTDSYWNEAHASGVAKLASTASVTGASVCDLDDVTVASSAYHTGSIWIMGRGRVEVAIGFGTGSITRVDAENTEAVQLTSEWYRVKLSDNTGGAENRCDLRIEPQEGGVCYFTGWQIEAHPMASGLIQTAGSTETREVDDQTFSQALPVPEGTISFWMYWPGTTAGSEWYTLISATGVAGTEAFILQYKDVDAANNGYIYHKSSGQDFLTIPQFADPSWHHIVTTWEEDPDTDDQLYRRVYVDTVECAAFFSGVTTSWEPFFGTGFVMGQAIGKNNDKAINGFRVEELRIDTASWSAAQIADQYDRLTSDTWLHMHRAHAGRKYIISNMQESWLHPSQPDKIVMELELTEVNREDDSVVVPA